MDVRLGKFIVIRTVSDRERKLMAEVRQHAQAIETLAGDAILAARCNDQQALGTALAGIEAAARKLMEAVKP